MSTRGSQMTRLVIGAGPICRFECCRKRANRCRFLRWAFLPGGLSVDPGRVCEPRKRFFLLLIAGRVRRSYEELSVAMGAL